MKKILSLTLAVLMVVSMIPTAFAAEAGGNWAGGTQVEATGSRSTVEDDGSVTHNAEYTITVPALLAPGGEGTVTLEGYWPSDATVKVTADASVDMLNSINNADKKTLAVTFPSIEKAGNNTQAVSASAPVSVADISAALFGTWSGKFNYNVEYNGEAGNSGTVTPTPDPEQPSDPDDGDDEPVVLNGSATFSDGVTLSWAELQLEENATKYGYSTSNITDTSVVNRAFQNNTYLTSITIPADVELDEMVFCGCTNLSSVAFTGDAELSTSTFDSCSNLTNVDLGDLHYICNNMFRRTALTRIDIPVSVTGISSYAFNESNNLTEIHYAGTKEQWAAINLGQAWNGNIPATEVICSDGTVSLS